MPLPGESRDCLPAHGWAALREGGATAASSDLEGSPTKSRFVRITQAGSREPPARSTITQNEAPTTKYEEPAVRALGIGVQGVACLLR